MTDEEKDILQDKVLQDEADYFEINKHQALLKEDGMYRKEFILKEGIQWAAAKEFIKKSLETPIIDIDEKDTVRIAAAMRAPVSMIDKSEVGHGSPRRTWLAIAAVLIIALVSTFYLSDFRSANEFALAEVQELPSSSKELFGSTHSTSRSGEVDWRRAFDEKQYGLVVNELNWLSVAGLDSLEMERLRKSQVLQERISAYSLYSSAPGDGPMETRLTNEIDSLKLELSKLESKIAQANQGEEKLSTLRFALALSKLKSNTAEASRDFGQYEFEWMLGDSSNYPTGVAKVDILWYNALSEYKAGDCEKTNSTLSELIKYSDSQYFKSAKKFKRKLERECDLN